MARSFPGLSILMPILGLLLLLSSRSLEAQAASDGPPRLVEVLRVDYLPEDFRVGQLVELRIFYTVTGQAATVSLFETAGPVAEPDSLPSVYSADLRRIGGEDCIVLRLIAWEPGPGQLPAFDHQGLRFPALPLPVGSPDPSAGEPVLLGQADIPGFQNYLFIAITLVLGLGGLLVTLPFSLPWLRFGLLARLQAWRSGRRLAVCLRGLSASQAPGMDEWLALGRALRQYLDSRTGSYDYQRWHLRVHNRKPRVWSLQALTVRELAGLDPGLFPAGFRDELCAWQAGLDRLCWSGDGSADFSSLLQGAARLAASFEAGLRGQGRRP